MSLVFARYPFFFLRHGVTDHNLGRLVMGQLDIPLNSLGRHQAETAALHLRHAGVARVLASPLARARETAEIVASRLHLPVEIVDGLKERDWGAMTGRSYRDLMRARHLPEGAETPEVFAQRILAALDGAPRAEPLLVVAHSGACRVLRRFLAIDDGEGPVPNAVPLLFSPTANGGWNEQPLAPCAAHRYR
jgi:probable phosphoglycerate mutase